MPGVSPFARMTLGGTRSAGIPLLGMGKEDAKLLLTLQAPYIIPLHVHCSPARFVGLRVLMPTSCPGNSSCCQGRTQLSGCCSTGSVRHRPWKQQE